MLIQDFVLESDSQILINALKDEAPPPTVVVALVYGSLFASYKFMLTCSPQAPLTQEPLRALIWKTLLISRMG